MGFLVAYAINLGYVVYYVARRHNFLADRRLLVAWGIGFALILGSSSHTWSDTHVNWFAAPLWTGAAVGFSWLMLRREERKEMLRTMLRWKEMRA
jgi:hypothetical protein